MLEKLIPSQFWNRAAVVFQLVYSTSVVKPLKRLIFSSYVDMGS